MIKLSVTRLEKEPIELVGDEPAEWLEIEPTELIAVSAPVHYDLFAQAVSGGALIAGKVRTQLTGCCGRCLEPTHCEVENSGIRLFYEMPAGDELDITEDIRAEMLLELPMTLTCDDDCQGLCPDCGANLNKKPCNCHSDNNESDDRWGALDNLKL